MQVLNEGITTYAAKAEVAELDAELEAIKKLRLRVMWLKSAVARHHINMHNNLVY